MPRKSSSSSYRTSKTSYRKPVRASTSRRAPRYKSSMGGQIGSAVGRAAAGAIATALAPETSGASLAFAPMASRAAGKVGSWIGEGLQGLISGHGDYKVSVNSILNPGNNVPMFRDLRYRRGTIIKHREYIADVVTGSIPAGSSSAFNIVPYSINPGNATSFPWLAAIANNFEVWQPLGILYEYKTTSGVIASNQSLGTVIMATQYNTLSYQFTTKQEMENYEMAVSTVPSKSCIHPIECDPKQTMSGGIFNTQNNLEAGAGADARLYDIGRFAIATVGVPNGSASAATVTLGELWVTYEICMMKPRLGNNAAGYMDHWATNAVGTAAGSNYFGTAITYPANGYYAAAGITNQSDGFTTLLNGTTLQFNNGIEGSFLVLWWYYGSGTAASPASPVMTPDGTQVFNNGILNSSVDAGSASLPYAYASTTAGSNPYITQYIFVRVKPQSTLGVLPQIVFSAGTLIPTPVHMDLIIIQIPSNAS